ncbi:hypothetical protein [Novosphingobium sp.]|uniref:hypothetical protein n=1 Tax=Novosphingobium sp. TaxID=1874826 RepID=UPI003565790F
MSPHTRAIVAAAAHAFMVGRRVAGVHDHASGQDLRIAAEVRGDRLQGMDGDRSSKFSGSRTEIYDSADNAFVSLDINGLNAHGFDRASSSQYSLTVTDQVVQLYDHSAGVWFAFSIQVV